MDIKERYKNLFKRYRYPSEIIIHAVYTYCRFSLSYRDIEEIMIDREF